MADIKLVEYEKIPEKAKQIREQAQSANREFIKAYRSIEELYQNWRGKRYRSFVSEFNRAIPILNRVFKLIVCDIPFSLEKIANNYANAEEGKNVCSAQQTSFTIINEIIVSSQTGIRFITDAVVTTQTKVSVNFDSASEAITKIEQLINSISWESATAKDFKNQFNIMKTKISNIISEMKRAFINNIKKAQEDMQVIELANIIK